jgi:putative endonuclease
MYWIYALYNSQNNKIYIGQTEDLERRVWQRNNHVFKGYTAQFQGEWVLIYKESAATRSQALTREKQLKSGSGRAYIKTHIPA